MYDCKPRKKKIRKKQAAARLSNATGANRRRNIGNTRLIRSIRVHKCVSKRDFYIQHNSLII